MSEKISSSSVTSECLLQGFYGSFGGRLKPVSIDPLKNADIQKEKIEYNVYFVANSNHFHSPKKIHTRDLLCTQNIY